MARVWIAFALAAALLLSWARVSSLDPQRESGILSIESPTPFYRFFPRSPSIGRVLVIHGLDASKEFMQIFCAALADAGFEVYAIDLPGHGDSPVAFTASRARGAIAEAIDHLGKVDAVVGHSLGAGLLLDLANERALPRTVLVSPPPTPLAQPDLSQTLVVTGGLDIPAINSFAANLEGVEWWKLPWAAHSTPFFNVANTRAIIQWLGGRSDVVLTGPRLRWNALLMISAIGLFICLLPSRIVKAERQSPGIAGVAVEFVLSGTAALLVLKFIPLMRWLRVFATDYIVAVVFLIGIILCAIAMVLRPEQAGKNSFKAFAIAGLAAAYVIIVVGHIAVSRFAHVSLGDGRWWRFLAIAAAGLPLFVFDEMYLRLRPGWNTVAVGVLTRALLAIALLIGVLVLNRESAFLVLVTHLLFAYWLALWFLTDIVRRHTQSVWAAALFPALVQGWCFAAWFVKI